jgi:hypothetical protein
VSSVQVMLMACTLVHLQQKFYPRRKEKLVCIYYPPMLFNWRLTNKSTQYVTDRLPSRNSSQVKTTFSNYLCNWISNSTYCRSSSYFLSLLRFSIFISNSLFRWSQWPRGLRRESAAAPVLELRVRIPSGGIDVCLLWLLCCQETLSVIRRDNNPLQLQ